MLTLPSTPCGTLLKRTIHYCLGFLYKVLFGPISCSSSLNKTWFWILFASISNFFYELDIWTFELFNIRGKLFTVFFKTTVLIMKTKLNKADIAFQIKMTHIKRQQNLKAFITYKYIAKCQAKMFCKMWATKHIYFWFFCISKHGI